MSPSSRPWRSLCLVVFAGAAFRGALFAFALVVAGLYTRTFRFWRAYLALSLLAFLRCTLERNAQTQLDPPAALRAVGRNQFRADHAKGGRTIDVKSRIEKVHMVEDVKEVGGDFHFVALMERRRLSQPRIQVPQAQSSKWMSRPVSPIDTDERITEVSRGGIWIRKDVSCPRRAEVLPGHAKMRTAT